MTTATTTSPNRPRRALERVEAEIVELSGQLAGATARLLALVGEFDAAEGWREWEMRSTAHWLSWKCGLSLTAGREQVRVARALRDLPVTSAEFAAGRLSYSKVRAITRMATPETERNLVETAKQMTAAQLDRCLNEFRKARRLQDVRERRQAQYLQYHYDDDGSLVGSFRVAPEGAAAFLQAVETSTGRITSAKCEGDESGDDRDARVRRTRVDALIGICEQHLAKQATEASADRAEIYQLVVHATLDDLKSMDNEDSAALGITLGGFGTGKLRIHPATAARLTCDCTVSVVIEDESGTPLHLNRKQRRVLGRLRRAVQIRDGGMCRAPGCTYPATQIHHIKHWADLGDTCLDNLISLCDGHHWAVHEGGFTVVTRSPGRWAFLSENGVTIEPEPDVPTAATALPFDSGIAADGCTGGWDGSRLSRSHVNDIVAPLLKAAEREDAPAGVCSTKAEIDGWADFLMEHSAVIDPVTLDSSEEWLPSDWPEEYEHAQDVSDWLRSA